MKKFAAIIIAILCLTCALARAQTYRLEDESNSYYVCQDFEQELPEDAQAIFSSLLRADDQVIGGTMFLEYYRNMPGMTNRGGALLALRRDGKILLLGANKYDKTPWCAAIETDCFFESGAEFKITCVPMKIGQYVACMHLAIVYGSETFAMRTTPEGGLYLWEYTREEADGTQTVIDCDSSSWDYGRRENDGMLKEYTSLGPLPVRIWAWTYETFPRTTAQIDAWTAQHPYPLAQDEGYISSVNLREKPTGKSKSWGEYSAKVKILGQQPGQDEPWYNVQVGSLIGWVSGMYLRTAGNGIRAELGTSQTDTCGVACARVDTQLFDLPGGAQTGTIPAGTFVYVIVENDGWLHIIIPRGELTWETDWDGTYGFVKAEDMAVGASKADAVWK